MAPYGSYGLAYAKCDSGAKGSGTADATAAAVDSLTTTVTQQGNLLTSTGNRTTQLENGWQPPMPQWPKRGLSLRIVLVVPKKAEKRNIFLVGPMGAGKSTIGRS